MECNVQNLSNVLLHAHCLFLKKCQHKSNSCVGSYTIEPVNVSTNELISRKSQPHTQAGWGERGLEGTLLKFLSIRKHCVYVADSYNLN